MPAVARLLLAGVDMNDSTKEVEALTLALRRAPMSLKQAAKLRLPAPASTEAARRELVMHLLARRSSMPAQQSAYTD